VPGIRYRRQMIDGIPVVAALVLAEGPAVAAPAVTLGSVGWARRSGAVSGPAGLPDRAALRGFVQWITGLGLDVTDLRLVALESW
jgi:hypothetical protein